MKFLKSGVFCTCFLLKKNFSNVKKKYLLYSRKTFFPIAVSIWLLRSSAIKSGHRKTKILKETKILHAKKAFSTELSLLFKRSTVSGELRAHSSREKN